jgi:hypothetical protein
MSFVPIKSLVLVLVSSFFLGGCNIQGLWTKNPAGLDITTDPKAQVLLNGEVVGETPYKNQNIKAATYKLQLIPLSTETEALSAWEAELTLTPNTTTIIKRSFSETITDTSSSILELQPEKSKKLTRISIISDPDTVNVTLNGKPQGFTPISKLDLEPGEHTVTLSSPGYASQTHSVRATAGFNLLINVKLALESYTLGQDVPLESSPSAKAFPSPSLPPQPPPVATTSSSASLPPPPYITVLDTADTQVLGGLNVRQEPSTNSDILGLAKIGDSFAYIETNSGGWHKIEFTGQLGWVSARYTNLTR